MGRAWPRPLLAAFTPVRLVLFFGGRCSCLPFFPPRLSLTSTHAVSWFSAEVELINDLRAQLQQLQADKAAKERLDEELSLCRNRLLEKEHE